jgi:uncharacterized membrane protein
MLISTHTLFGVVALASGAAVLLRRKGDHPHRVAGWVYAVSMLLLCIGSYWIQDSTPFFRGLGPFHIAATVSLATLIVGIASVRRDAPPESRAAGHVRSMVWSYAGLVMATGSHFIQPIGLAFRDGLGLAPGAAFPLAVALCWGVPPMLTVLGLKRRRDDLEALFQRISGRSEPSASRLAPDPASGEAADAA